MLRNVTHVRFALAGRRSSLTFSRKTAALLEHATTAHSAFYDAPAAEAGEGLKTRPQRSSAEPPVTEGQIEATLSAYNFERNERGWSGATYLSVKQILLKLQGGPEQFVMKSWDEKSPAAPLL